MKAISMTQPWATLLAIGGNVIETRGWSTRYRGPLAIHAAKSFPSAARALCRQSPFRESLANAGYSDERLLPLGAIIARVELVDVMSFDGSSADLIRARSEEGTLPRHELAFGDFSAGRFGFVVRNVCKLREPIPARGMLSLWEVPQELETEISLQGC
jgi:hypothetical protein